MDRRTKYVSAVALAGALFAEPIAGEFLTALAQPLPHVESAVVPDGRPTTCVSIWASGAAAATRVRAFYVAMTPVHMRGRGSLQKSFVVSVLGTPVKGDYFSLDKTMSLLGRFIPHGRLRAIRGALLAGKPQVVAGQRKGTGAAPIPKVTPTPPSGTPSPPRSQNKQVPTTQ